MTSQNPAAAVGGVHKLTFNTAAITINPGAYTGQYLLHAASPSRVTGPQTTVVLAGLSRYVVQLQHEGAEFRFDVDDSGNVYSQVAAAATGVDATLNFNTETITIDPGALTAEHGLSFISSRGTGIQTHELLPGLDNYYVEIRQSGTNFQIFDNFYFNVDANGDVTPRNSVVATGMGSTLAINTTEVKVDPGDYASGPGIQTYQLPANHRYSLWLYHDGPRFTFNVDTIGNITSNNEVAATGDGNKLSFNTTSITVDPVDYSGTYSVQAIAKVEALGLSTGTEGGLLSKLEAVVTMLEVDVSSDAGVLALLEAFKSGIERWYSRGVIEEDDRDSLFADVDLIILGITLTN